MTYRKIWFITRPERDPKFHRDALKALAEATDNFRIVWAGNRNAHIAYEKALNRLGVKRENISNDGSGGRTWAALLKTFSYIYTNEDGYIIPTKSAQKLLAGEKVRENVIKQILTLQIPNAYFLSKGFRPKFEDGFRIRPARFLIKLVNRIELDWFLTREEIIFFALTATNDDELDEITDKIHAYRHSSDIKKAQIRNDIASKYEHRERSDKGARDFQSAHGDVAHTFMLICEYTELVEYVRGDSILRVPLEMRNQTTLMIDELDNRYPFNTRFLISLERLAENNGLDVDSYKASSFSGQAKQASNKSKTARKVKNLIANIPMANDLPESDLRKLLLNEFSAKETDQIMEDLAQYEFRSINIDFVEGYLNEQNNLKFEDKTGEILRLIGFNVSMRPKPVPSATTEIEILAEYDDKEFGIIDAKNYRQKFSLSANLVSHMVSEYIPNYDGYKGKQLMFYGYVTAADIGTERNLEKITELAERIIPGRKIRGFMINASTLLGFLDYCLENDIPQSKRIDLFLKAADNSSYTTLAKLLNKVL